jgi:DNA-binding transcriptional MerR regulator
MKNLKLFYSTDEVAEHFEVAPSKIRYYEREFNLKIRIQGKNKAFTKRDIEKLAEIIALTDEENYKLQGVKEQLKTRKSKKPVNIEVIERLTFVKDLLIKIKG